jgi:ABC-2 type transport system ATP-binding protein
MNMNAIETTNLTKYYGKARGIIDVNLKVEEGQLYGFIGPNGAGKSTTIRTLLSLIKKTSGQAEIFGLDCETQKVEILKQVGYLPSEVSYYDNMKAIDLLNYSASFYGKDCSDKIKILSDALEVDLNRKIEDMSLGNRKKVGIVQGLLHSPRLIMLDEPTSGLDPLMQKTFFELIRNENKNGATVLFSSHILSEVQRLCDRVAIIKEGKIIKEQSINGLREEAYKKVSMILHDGVAPNVTGLEGVSDLRVMGTTVEFIFRGDCNLLIEQLAKHRLLNLEISEPDLEEIFMHYYQ